MASSGVRQADVSCTLVGSSSYKEPSDMLVVITGLSG
jgi:hypothetical protein